MVAGEEFGIKVGGLAPVFGEGIVKSDSRTETQEFLGALRGLLTVHPSTVETHETGLALTERYGFSVYDAMIVAAALGAGCGTLYSEAMQHGMILEEGLRIVDPFRQAE